MVVVKNTQGYCKNLAGGDDKWNDMLFELFDDAVDEDLTHETEDTDP